jgi:hypothetical protein
MEKVFPIEIAVSVKGKERSAMIFGRVADKNGFLVRFNDGFEDEFILAGEENDLGPIGSKPGWQDYAPCLKNDLSILAYLQDGQFVQSLRSMIEGVPTTVWIVEEFPNTGNRNQYVYYMGECRFKMQQSNGQWIITNHYSGDPATNAQLAKQAGQAVARLN